MYRSSFALSTIKGFTCFAVLLLSPRWEASGPEGVALGDGQKQGPADRGAEKSSFANALQVGSMFRIEDARDGSRVDPDVTVKVKLEKHEFRALEPIRLFVEIENNSDNHRWLSASNCIYNVMKIYSYQFNLLVEKTRFLKNAGDVGMSGGGQGMALNPGRIYRTHVTANLVNDMTNPGEYSLFVEFYTGICEEIDGKSIPLVGRSKEIKLRVLDIPKIIGPEGLDENPL